MALSATLELDKKYRLEISPALVGPAKMWLERNFPGCRLIYVWDLREKIVPYTGSGHYGTSFGVILAHDDQTKHRILWVKSAIRSGAGNSVSWRVYDDLPLPMNDKVSEVVRNALIKTILPRYNGELPLYTPHDAGIILPGKQTYKREPMCPLSYDDLLRAQQVGAGSVS